MRDNLPIKRSDGLKVYTYIAAIMFLGGACTAPDTLEAHTVQKIDSSNEIVLPKIPTGDYDCRVMAKTVLAAVHFENSGPPIARASNEPGIFFGVSVDLNENGELRITEIETEKRPINQYELEFGLFPSVLMVPYIRDGLDFRAPGRADFMQFYGAGNSYHFWQSAYQYPGGEDTQLVTRYGDCWRR